jgi:hypothetical protein
VNAGGDRPFLILLLVAPYSSFLRDSPASYVCGPTATCAKVFIYRYSDAVRHSRSLHTKPPRDRLQTGRCSLPVLRSRRGSSGTALAQIPIAAAREGAGRAGLNRLAIIRDVDRAGMPAEVASVAYSCTERLGVIRV